MIASFILAAPLLWPHALLILLASWLGARRRTFLASSWVGVGAAVVATLVYWALRNGVVADRRDPIPGQLAANFLAGSLSLVAAAVVSQAARSKGAGFVIAIIIGVAAGLLLLVPMPFLAVGLGCAFTEICP